MRSSNKNKTFNQIVKLYMNDTKYSYKKVTLMRFNNIYTHQIKPILGSLTVNDVTRSIINKWKRFLCKNEYSTSTIVHSINFLKTLYRYHVNILNGQTNPVLEYLKPFKANPNKVILQKDIVIWSLDEIILFLNTCDKLEKEMMNGPNRNYYHGGFSGTKAVVALCALAGLRPGEAVALQVKDLIKSKGLTYVNIYKTKAICFTIDDPKVLTTCKSTASIRKVPIPDMVKEILEKQIEDKKMKKNYFFSSGTKYPISDYIKRIKIKVEKACGLKHTRLHDLRHSYVQILINEGITPSNIAKLLGHSCIEVVLKNYYQLYTPQQKEIVDTLNNNISKLNTKKIKFSDKKLTN